MNRYGQALVAFGTADAPHLYTGDCTSFSADDRLEETLDTDEVGDNRALILDRALSELSFDGKVTDGSTDFLDISAGCALTVTGYDAGIVAAYSAEENWVLGQAKTASVRARHYPFAVLGGGAAAGATLSAFTPDQSALTTVTPGAKIIWGTYGMNHASGVLHGLRLTQSLTLTNDDPSPDGKILGFASHGYVRRQELMVLAKAAAPAKGSTLVVTNGPAHSAGFKVTGTAQSYVTLKGLMYRIPAVWIPAFT